MSFCFLESNPSYWMSGRIARSFGSALGQLKSEVVIIGAGLTGLSTAFHIKSAFPKWKVIVLEKWFVGSGASGRSGGVIVNHEALPGSLQDVSFLSTFLDFHRIKCDLRSRKDHPFQQLLNPYQLTLSLVQMCLSIGVQLYEESEVVTVDVERRIVEGAMFNIVSSFLFLATDARGNLFDPGLHRIGKTIQNCVAVRVGAQDKSGPDVPWVYYQSTNNDEYVWGRQLAEDVFLFGNEEIQTHNLVQSDEDAGRAILSSIGFHLPEYHVGEIVAKWSGLISRFEEGSRRILQLDSGGGCHFVGGYDGYGIAGAVRSGSVVASILKGAPAPSDFPLVSSGLRTGRLKSDSLLF